MQVINAGCGMRNAELIMIMMVGKFYLYYSGEVKLILTLSPKPYANTYSA